MHRDSWSELVTEDRSVPRPITEEDFREWMSGVGVFVSSVMDEEMTPARAVARETIERLGGRPVMWEVLAPADRRPGEAYIAGIEQSDLMLLMLGHNYGVSDETGFSPTHKESNRAENLRITRLLFQPDPIDRSRRSGKLNEWMSSLYNQVSGAKYINLGDLSNQIESKMREVASQQQNYWIKLDNLVFPGEVKTRTTAGTTTYTITARVRQPEVKERVSELGRNSPRSTRLTWGERSVSVSVHDVSVNSVSRLEDEVVIVCPEARNQGSNFMGVTIQQGAGAQAITPDMQAEDWARMTFLGEASSLPPDAMRYARFLDSDALSLQSLLAQAEARGWYAEGLANLFIVEKIKTIFDGTVTHIQVGPATANGMRLNLQFRMSGYEPRTISLNGLVIFSQIT
jgi:hypothetical protein